MKKILLVLIVMLMAGVSSFAEHNQQNWMGLKIGYGNETGGIGVGLENRIDNAGFLLGAGIFSGGYFGGSIVIKGYSDISDSMSLFGSLGYGLLGVYHQWDWNSTSGSSYYSDSIWGPFLMVGLNGFFDGLIADSSIGIGYNPEYGSIFTLQSSIGWTWDI